MHWRPKRLKQTTNKKSPGARGSRGCFLYGVYFISKYISGMCRRWLANPYQSKYMAKTEHG